MMMTPTNGQLLLAIVNCVLCLFVAYSCLMRAKVMRQWSTRWSWQLRYAALFGVSVVGAFAPLTMGEWPGWFHISIEGALLSIIGLGGSWEEDGVPPYAKKHNVKAKA